VYLAYSDTLFDMGAGNTSSVQSVGFHLNEEVDAFGVPLNEDAGEPTDGLWYVVPYKEKDRILKRGIEPLHYREYVYLLKAEAMAHAKYLERHYHEPISVFEIVGQVKVWHVKNALYWKTSQSDHVHMAAVGKVPVKNIRHVKDVGMIRKV
jgi:hypothetical protein